MVAHRLSCVKAKHLAAYRLFCMVVAHRLFCVKAKHLAASRLFCVVVAHRLSCMKAKHLAASRLFCERQSLFFFASCPAPECYALQWADPNQQQTNSHKKPPWWVVRQVRVVEKICVFSCIKAKDVCF